MVEDRIGSVEPGRALIIKHPLLREESSEFQSPHLGKLLLKPEEIPPDWLESFPTPIEIMLKAIQMKPVLSLNPDERLMVRRHCEYALYESIEHAHYFPKISQGFANMRLYSRTVPDG